MHLEYHYSLLKCTNTTIWYDFVLPQPYTGINPINMSRGMEEVIGSVQHMILAGGDITIKQVFGCRSCGKSKSSDYCRSCRENTKNGKMVMVSTKMTFPVE